MRDVFAKELKAEMQLVQLCKQACDEIDYDMGSELLDTYLQSV